MCFMMKSKKQQKFNENKILNEKREKRFTQCTMYIETTFTIFFYDDDDDIEMLLFFD